MVLCFRWVILRRCIVCLIMVMIVGEKVSMGCDMIIIISVGCKIDEMFLGVLMYCIYFLIMDFV